MKRMNLLLLVSTSLLLAACAPEPVVVAAAPAPIVPAPIVMSNTPIQNEACCFNPAEMVQYRNVAVPNCTKNVEVIRYKNSCVDCAYPVVVRNNSLCAK